MSDVWYSQQIAKQDIAAGRDAETIRKHLKKWKKLGGMFSPNISPAIPLFSVGLLWSHVCVVLRTRHPGG